MHGPTDLCSFQGCNEWVCARRYTRNYVLSACVTSLPQAGRTPHIRERGQPGRGAKLGQVTRSLGCAAS